MLQQGLDLMIRHQRRLNFLVARHNSLVHLKDVVKHTCDLLHEKGHRPGKKIHVVGQVKGLGHIRKLLDVHAGIVNQNHRAFVFVFTAVIWRAKNRDHRGKCFYSSPSVHLVAVWFNLVSSDY